MTLRQYAEAQIDVLTGRFEQQAQRLTADRGPGAIHDLRVSIRRLTQSLKAFAGVLPRKECKRLRRRIKPLMDAAGEVRTRDIALELFASAGVPMSSAPCVRLALERENAITELTEMVARGRQPLEVANEAP